MSATYKPWEMAASHPPKLHDCWRVRLQPPCVGGRYSHPTQARRLTRRLENWVSHLPIHWRVDVGRFLVLEEPSLFEGSRRTYINTAIRAILCIDTIALEEGSRGCNRTVASCVWRSRQAWYTLRWGSICPILQPLSPVQADAAGSMVLRFVSSTLLNTAVLDMMRISTY